jgi:hypothetical protein
MNSPIARAGGFLSLTLFVFLTGCSNFDREWKDAGQRQITGIEGRWEGSWKSEGDGHHGALLCVIRHGEGDLYNASFSATYSSIFHFAYDAKLTGHEVDKLVHLTGEENLGCPVGVYHYDGTADPTQFYCAYRSKDDHGYFSLARPGGAAPPTQPISDKQLEKLNPR